MELTTDTGRCTVLREKLRAPEPAGLVRDRLTAPAATTMVVAPAGCGKTTLLSHLAAAAQVPVGWYGVTEDDTCENRFIAHLAGALGGLADIADVASTAGLLAALDRWTGPGAVLFLDDVHAIAGSAAERALEQFLALRPRRLRVVCASRRTPDVNVPRLRVSGSLGEIGGDDLRFRTSEIEELFAAVYGCPLRPDAATALARSTGGWAAALWLFQLATAQRSAADRHRAVAHLGGRCRHVRSYLTRNVLHQLSADRREFLLRTAPLERMSGEVCDALLGATGSHRILSELEAAQLFTSTDDGGRHFRYHEVLRTHLELALVEEYGVAEAQQWYRRCAQVSRLAKTVASNELSTAATSVDVLVPEWGRGRAPAGTASVPAMIVRCFGEFGIEAGGRAVALDALRPQARRVLQILALAPGRDHHCEYLEDLLWPGVQHSVAAHRLQVAVSSARRLLVEHGVSVDRRGESYRLCLPESAAVDVVAFADAVARAGRLAARGDVAGRLAARRAALDLYTGDLLPELTGMAHVEGERDRLRHKAAAVAAALAADHLALGEHDRALAAAERSVQLEPEQDTGWLVLADLHAELGDAGSAEYVRREHARIRAELGVPTLVRRGRSAGADQIRPSRTA
ncbi:AAA family ATPase [Mycobacterium manitobense]|uniref:AAA family ATPase n=1 Tax=[Mycobacterium] manitobense TaxID=190147 RepID=A0A9X2YTU3_9MYCO|nr:BTAD domain-containing putative transcriptional regulator [[Mycobacterium] manitobense]MCV7173136.1 AAA family ATPase [[Mycobacterium] manitobense]